MPKTNSTPSRKRAATEDLDILPAIKTKRANIDIDPTNVVENHDSTYDSVESIQSPAAALAASMTSHSLESSRWQKTVQQSIKAIVSIRFNQVSTFDTDSAVTSEATGFVVDKTRGIILTNRHVACSGPFVGDCVFHDHEEVDVVPIYRDCIHDFGFLKFDPSKIKYMDLHEIPLRPDLARVGLDIRVVGNDAGEKLSILAGAISRLDRNVPDYGDLTYNDFNSFYLQASASTSGGSSGSPVLDIDGNAVALQAGGRTEAATDFFFPLDRVKRALELIQAKKPVVRGTIQVQWLYRAFDEVRRLGLSSETEAKIRKINPEEVGMLVCEVVVPKGPGSGKLEEGDVLISVDGEYVTKFVPLEAALDDHVGKSITLVVSRNGEEMSFDINVQDLHSITPDRYLECGGAKLNDVSYQLARQFCVPVEGVYLAEQSGMLRLDSGHDNSGYIIKEVDSKPTPNLDAFLNVIKNIPDRERIPITYYSIADTHTKNVAIVVNEQHWSSLRLVVRNDETGLWDFTDLSDSIPPAKQIEPKSATFPVLDESLGVAKDLFRCLVKVNFYMPIKIDGFPRSRKIGAGLIVDKATGLVVVGRNVVPHTMGDISITVADSIIIPGKVEYIHPTHNLAFVRYDPALIGSTPVCEAQLSTTELAQGHSVTLAAFNHNFKFVCIQTTVTDVSPVTIPPSGVPRFRAINFESINLDTQMASQCSSGILADSEGKVQGLWLSFLGERNQHGQDHEYHLGLPISVLNPVLASLKKGDQPRLRGLAAECVAVQMSQARHMGVTDEWVQKVEEANPSRRQLFLVRSTECGAPTTKVLKDLDLILSVNGKTITRISELDVSTEWGEQVDMVIIRQKQIMNIKVPTTVLDGEGCKHVVSWAGALIQEPHKAVLQQSRTLPSRVYVGARSKGSPAYMYGLVPTTYILAVNGISTPDLPSFVAAVSKLPDNQYVRVRTMSFDLQPMVLTIKTCGHYWPTSELVRDRDSSNLMGWKRAEIVGENGVKDSNGNHGLEVGGMEVD